MRKQVRDSRSAELDSYAKAASQIEATGVAEADKVYQSAANNLRNAAVEAHNQNILGFTSRSFATSQVNNYTSQASQVANATKYIADKVEAMDKGIADGKIDPYSKSRLLRTWFTNKNLNQTKIEVRDANGNITYVPTIESLGTDMIDDKLHFVKSFNYKDPNSGQVMVGTRSQSVHEFFDQNPKMYELFDTNKWVKDLSSTISGSRAVESIRGEELGSAPSYVGYRIGDADGFYRVIAPERLADVGNTIENQLDALVQDDNAVISFLSQTYGARAVGDEGFRGLKSEKEILELFGERDILGEDGKPTGEKLPSVYDYYGNAIQFTNKDASGNIIDPLHFQLDEYGQEIISDDQRNLVKGILRDRMLKSFNIKLDDYKQRDRLASRKSPTAPIYDVSPLVYNRKALGDETFDGFQNVKFDYNALRSISAIEMAASQGLAGQRSLSNVLAEKNNNGYASGGSLNQIQQTYINEEFEYYPVQFGDKGLGELTKNAGITLTSSDNKEIVNPTSFIVVEDPDGNSKPKLLMLGQVVVADTKQDYELEQGGSVGAGSGVKLNEKGKVVVDGLSLVEDTQVGNLYKQMYNDIPGFKEKMVGLGWTGKTAQGPTGTNNDYYLALQAYANSINQ